MNDIIYRTVVDFEELLPLMALQQTAWASDTVSSAVHMRAAILQGGSVIAAYDGTEAVGFCYGFAAFDGQASYFHSHMMAVHPQYRDRGIGKRLKLEQRLWAIAYGYSAITWTFDPFQPRNAYLNLCKLAGTVSRYIPKVYGTDETGDPSDRFLIRWELESPRVRSAVQGTPAANPRWAQYPILLNDPEKEPEPPRAAIPRQERRDGGGFLLAVPKDAAAVKQRSPAIVVAWKRRLRELCEDAFACGYRVAGFLPGGGTDVSYYVLERAEDQ